MIRRKHLAPSIVLALGLILCINQPPLLPDEASPGFALIDLGPSASISGLTTRINDHRQLLQRGFELNHGSSSIVDIDKNWATLPLIPIVSPMSHNNRGDLVGHTHNGRMAIFDRLGHLVSIDSDRSRKLVPSDINERREIVGHYAKDGKLHGFRWSEADGFVDLAVQMNKRILFTRSINNRGDVVGQCVFESAPHAYLLKRNGKIVDLHPGGQVSHAVGINDHGEVVGYYTDEVQTRAFYWSEKTGHLRINDLASSLLGDWHFVRAIDINNRGDIVATATTDAEIHRVILTRTGQTEVSLYLPVPDDCVDLGMTCL